MNGRPYPSRGVPSRLSRALIYAVATTGVIGCARAIRSIDAPAASPPPTTQSSPALVTETAAREGPAPKAPPAVISLPTPDALPLTPGSDLPPRHRAWIDSTIKSLSVRERVAQMVMIWVLGDFTNSRDPGFLKVLSEIEQNHVGGVTMSLGSPIEVVDKVNTMQRHARIPLLVASDVEPGLGRLEGGVFATSNYSAGSATVMPSNMAIGATGSEAYAEAVGAITGIEARAVGIHLAFAPVVDVNNNPSNPVINTRSFGEDPQQVAALSAAFVRGLQRTGVAATAKHFPGHGDTDVDSHLGLPTITANRARLDAVELVPFAAVVAAGAAGMMTAHIALPNAYGDNTPATLSSRVMQGLLRDTLQFRGLTITDAMTMQGIAKGYGTEESAIRAVEAGDDIVLMPADVTKAIDAVVGAVSSGRVSEARIDVSVRRILELKLRTGAIAHPQVSLETARDSVATPEHRAVAQAVADHAVTLLRDAPSLVPLHTTQTIRVISIAPENDVQSGTWFGAEMRALSPRVTITRLSPQATGHSLDSLTKSLRKTERVVVYTYTRTLEGEGRLAIPAPVAKFVNKLAKRGSLVVVAGGNPYQIRQMAQIPTYLATFGRGEALERAAARALFGRIALSGKSPVTLPGYFARGDGIAHDAVATTPGGTR